MKLKINLERLNGYNEVFFGGSLFGKGCCVEIVKVIDKVYYELVE